MPRVTLGPMRVHYQQMGRGPDIVLVHGLFSNLAFWYMTIMPALAKDFRVTAYDLRGHGLTDMPRRGYTSRALAGDLHALLEHLEIQRAHLVGHSFGGAVALHYAVLHPERVSLLTVADGQIPCFQPLALSSNAMHWRRASRELRRSGVRVPENLPRVGYRFLEECIKARRRGAEVGPWQVVLPDWNGHSKLEARWGELMGSTSAAAELPEEAGLTVERAGEIPPATLAVFGEESPCLPTLRGLERTLPRCRTAIVAGAGHFHPVFKPRQFVEEVRSFSASEARNGQRGRPVAERLEEES